jgi:hypothetical protein
MGSGEGPAGLHCEGPRPAGLLPLLAAWLRWQASERISEEMMSDDEPDRFPDQERDHDPNRGPGQAQLPAQLEGRSRHA